LRDHTDVVMDALRLAGITAYRGGGPANPLTAAPYAVVYSGTATSDGPSANPYDDAHTEVQVTSVGVRSDQAEFIADRVHVALLSPSLAPPPGRAWLNPGAPVGHVLSRGVVRDDDFGASSPMFYAIGIYALPTTPA
jgi:hypothetical protein